MANKKQQLNEFGLIAVLGTMALWYCMRAVFDAIATNIDAYYHGRNPKVQKALEKITKSLAKSSSFIDKINKKVPSTGIGPQLISAVMTFPEMERELNKYKDDKDINFEELKLELVKAYTKGMDEEADERGITADMDKKLQSIKWMSEDIDRKNKLKLN
jgi:hypothetical protein